MNITAARLHAGSSAPPAELLFDPSDAEFRAEPYARYARIRREAPVHWCPLGEGGWVVARYAECQSLLGDPRLGAPRSARRRTRRHAFAAATPQGPAQAECALRHDFEARLAASLSDRAEAAANRLLDRARERQEIDLIDDFALPLSRRAAGLALQLSGEEQTELDLAGAAVLRGFEAPPTARAAARSLLELGKRISDTTRRRPDAHLLEGLAGESGAPARARRVAVSLELLEAGCGPVAALIGNGALALMENREQLLRLRVEAALTAGAARECLRFDPPLQYCGRVASEEIELCGARIEAGQRVFLLLASANRDPAAFDHPTRFDIARTGPPQLCFGAHGYFGVGSALGRLTAAIALRALARRLPRLAPIGEERLHRPTVGLRMLAELPVRC